MRSVVFAGALAWSAAALAGAVSVGGAPYGNLSVPVKSLREARFASVVRQQHDFSCGSAAVATLLTHHYRDPVGEEEVFRAMYESGDREKIRTQGFSLLDMKRYLARRGYQADGFRVPLGKISNAKVPALALVRANGYNHFVVVKGLDGRDVLIGDPSQGLKTMPRAEFETMWNGILFVIRDHTEQAAGSFDRREDWKIRRKAPAADAGRSQGLAGVTVLVPNTSDF